MKSTAKPPRDRPGKTSSHAVRDQLARLPDLASRRLGGSVIAANDELFAEKENLIRPEAPAFSPSTFGLKGQIYDGWETRRRREPGHDHAMVRLGAAGIVRGVVVDTAFFVGNYPPEVSVEGCAVEGYPSPNELEAADWVPLVTRSPIQGDAANAFPVNVGLRCTHIRLSIYPDGGVARLRVHGEVIPDPRFLGADAVDLAALENGGGVTAVSNMHYSSPENLIAPGLARVMGEGWETARRRDDGNDWVELRLAGCGVVRVAELDTSHFVGNAPGWASLSGWDVRRSERPDDPASPSSLLLPRVRLQPDTRHRFRLGPGPEVTHARLDVYPDGGMARLRLYGSLTVDGRTDLALRWLNTMPASQARAVLHSEAQLDDVEAEKIVASRPVTDVTRLPQAVRSLIAGSEAESSRTDRRG